MQVTEAQKLLRDTLDKNGLPYVRAEVNNRLTRVFGRYKYGLYGKSVELSSPLVSINDLQKVRTVILHEVAHALTEGHGHDMVWRLKCLEIGGDGKRCYSSADTNTIEKTRRNKLYKLVCQKCGYEGGRYRRKMNGYWHKGCHGKLESIEIN